MDTEPDELLGFDSLPPRLELLAEVLAPRELFRLEAPAACERRTSSSVARPCVARGAGSTPGYNRRVDQLVFVVTVSYI